MTPADALLEHAIAAHEAGDTTKARRLWAARRELLLTEAIIRCAEDGVQAMADLGPIAGSLAALGMWEASKQSIWSEALPWVGRGPVVFRWGETRISVPVVGGPPIVVEATVNEDGTLSAVIDLEET